MKTLEQRFSEKVDRGGENGCWLWTASTNTTGYGQIFDRRVNRPVGAHRVAYELFVGPIPDGLHIDHLCRVPRCVNPAHLEPVTVGENSRRGMVYVNMRTKARARTHCSNQHEMTEANTWVEKNGKRRCRACSRNRMRPKGAPAQRTRGPVVAVVERCSDGLERLACGHVINPPNRASQNRRCSQCEAVFEPSEVDVA